MPNWCENKLVVVGLDSTGADIAAFEERYFVESELPDGSKVKALSLNKIIPMPEELLLGEAWYQWRISHWGTKWDIDPATFHVIEPGVYFFDTAWAPPIRALQALFAQNHESYFMESTYLELGLFFCGGLQSHHLFSSLEWSNEDDSEVIKKIAIDVFSYDIAEFDDDFDEEADMVVQNELDDSKLMLMRD